MDASPGIPPIHFIHTALFRGSSMLTQQSSSIFAVQIQGGSLTCVFLQQHKSDVFEARGLIRRACEVDPNHPYVQMQIQMY
jgi:hypothetical protein